MRIELVTKYRNMIKTKILGLFIVLFSALSFNVKAQYCTTGLYNTACQYGDDLNSVTIGTFSHLNTGCTSGGYADYTSDTISVAVADPIAVSITSSYSGQNFGIWIDLNDDGDFNDAGEFVWNSTVASGATQGNFTLPITATLGTYHLRVRGKYEASAFAAADACKNENYGETHDYMVEVTAAPTCPTPYAVTVDSLTATAAYLSWASTGTAFSVEYDTTGFALGTGQTVTTTSANVVISGLTANKTYDFYVNNNCTAAGNGTSNTSFVTTFTTNCAGYTLPYFNNFENEIASGWPDYMAPSCWTKYNSDVNIGEAYTFDATWAPAYSGLQQLIFENNNANVTGDTIILVSPEMIGLENSDKQLVFRAKNENTNGGDIFVGTVSSTLNPSNFTVLDTFALTTSYDEYTLLLDVNSGYNGQDRHIVFGHANTNSYANVFVDDVKVEDIPACPKPLSIATSNITSSSADVSWTSPGTSFEFEYGASGFTQGTGTLGTTTNTSINVTNLFSNTCYDVYVRRDCGIDGNSIWAGPFTFCTLCDAIATPLTENFDNAIAGGSDNPSEPSCWTYVEPTGHTGYGYTSSSSWQNPLSAPNHWLMANASSINQLQFLVSPKLATITSVPVQTKFNAKSNAVSGATIIIGSMGDITDPSTFNAIDTVSITSLYAEYTVALTASNGYNGTDEYLAYAYADPLSYRTLYLDDILIEDVPQCYPSTNFFISNPTSTSASLNWTNGQGVTRDLEYGSTGFLQGTGTMIAGLTSSNVMVNGLTPNTCYDVYIKDSCGATGVSPWAGPFTFCSLCSAFNTPITEGFENTPVGDYQTTTFPECWSLYESPSSGGSAYVFTSTWNAANTGDNQFFMDNANNFVSGDSIMLISPEIIGLDSNNRKVELFARHTSAFSRGELVVGTVENPLMPSTFVAIDTLMLTDLYTKYSVIINTAIGYEGTHKYLAFAHANSKSYQTVYFDDISIEKLPACSVPFNMAESNVTTSDASITWNSVNGTAYKLEYGEQGFIQGTGALSTIVSNTTSPTVITGLMPNTYYDVYIADNCDTNSWTGPLRFKTECVGQLSGVYTVGGTAGPNNFATLDSALSVLKGCGINGPVTFNLAPGTYNTAFTINEINGSSIANKVTFNGNGVTDTIKTNSSFQVILLNGAKNLEFKNFTLSNPTGNGGFAFSNGSENIVIDNVHIYGSDQNTNFTSAGILTYDSNINSVTGDHLNNIEITNSKIYGFGAGINVGGEGNSSFNSGLFIKNVEILSAYNNPIKVYYYDDVHIEGVKIRGMRSSFGNGVDINYVSNLVFTKNDVYSPSFGVYIYSVNEQSTPTTNSIISNNFISGGSRALYLGFVYDTDVLHNSTNGSEGVYFSGNSSNVNLYNNIFRGSSYAVNSTSWGVFNNINFDYNLYNTLGADLANWGGAGLLDLAAWQAADTTNNDNSLEGNPMFVSATDLHVLGTLADSAANPAVSLLADIDEDTRSTTTPDMGADEYDVFSTDVATIAVVEPTNGMCGDSSLAVYVAIQNLGQNAFTAATVSAEVNGNTLSANYTGNLMLGETDTVMVGTFTQISGTTVSITAYSVLTGDQNFTNDTLAVQREIKDVSAPVVMATADSVCAGESVGLFLASPATGYFAWLDGNNDTVALVNAADTAWVQNVTATTTYSLIDAPIQTQVAPVTSGIGGNNNSIFSNGLVFEVASNVILNSVDVFPDTAGTVVVNIFEAGTSNAVFTDSVSVMPVTSGGVVTIAINQLLAPGKYELTANGSSVSMLSNAYGSTYPYQTANDELSILSATNGNTSEYYFFYNWKVGVYGCARPMVSQTIQVNPKPTAAFTYNIGAPTFVDQTVSFDASTSVVADSISWNFGDGSTGSGVNTTHDYASNNSFVVTMIAYNTCGTDTITDTVNTHGINIHESELSQSLNVYPNPNSGRFQVEFTLIGLQSVNLNMVNSIGQSVYFEELGNIAGDQKLTVDVEGVASGIYVLQVIANSETTYYKLRVQ